MICVYILAFINYINSRKRSILKRQAVLKNIEEEVPVGYEIGMEYP